jgi:hypothetical protein
MLKRANTGIEYHCEFFPNHFPDWQWFSLAKNKFGNIVAGVLLQKDSNSVLPRFIHHIPCTFGYFVRRIPQKQGLFTATR